MIYVLTSGIYSDYHVVGVFSTKENAEFAAAEMDLYEPNIEGYEIDQTAITYFEVGMDVDGKVLYVFEQHELGDFTEGWDLQSRGGMYPKSIENRVVAKDKKHAVKLTNDLRARLIADETWSTVPLMSNFAYAEYFCKICFERLYFPTHYSEQTAHERLASLHRCAEMA